MFTISEVSLFAFGRQAGKQAGRHGAGEVAESYTLTHRQQTERGERIGETGPSMGF